MLLYVEAEVEEEQGEEGGEGEGGVAEAGEGLNQRTKWHS